MPGGSFDQSGAGMDPEAMFNAPPGSPMAQKVDQAVGVMQKKTMDPNQLLDGLIKQGMSPHLALARVEQMKPMIEMHNNAIFDERRIDILSKEAGLRAAAEERNRLHQIATERHYENMDESRAADVTGKNIRREQGAQEAQAKIDLMRERYGSAMKSETQLTNDPSSKRAIDFYAMQQIGGDSTWRTGLSRQKSGADLILAVDKRVPQMAEELGLSAQEIGTKKAQRVALSTALRDQQKRLSIAEPFIVNFNKQADLVEKYMGAGAAGADPIINRWIQAGRRAVAGDPDVTAFDTAIRGAGREHQRIVTGISSNAQLHAAAAEMADQLINPNMTPDQIRSTLHVMREEGNNLVSAQKDQVGSLQSQITGLVPSAKADTGKGSAPVQTATNPKTGEKLELRDGQWMPVK